MKNKNLIMDCKLTYDLHERLSEHFILAEFLVSDYAYQHNIMNLPHSMDVVDNLRLLSRNVLEPLRGLLGRPLRITSGYRSERLNKALHGATRSQHLTGEAADLYCRDSAAAEQIYRLIRDHLPFDQLILENRWRTGTWWIHVSYTARRPLRRQQLYKLL